MPWYKRRRPPPSPLAAATVDSLPSQSQRKGSNTVSSCQLMEVNCQNEQISGEMNECDRRQIFF